MKKKPKNKSVCSQCAHFDTDAMKCTAKGGKLSGIELTDDLADADHDCAMYEEAYYRVTPKGLLWDALYNAGITMQDKTFDKVWESFAENMQKLGYTEEKR